MTKDEALKLALEALENAEYGDYDKKELNEAITAIKELRPQPEQEPVAWRFKDPMDGHWLYTTHIVDLSKKYWGFKNEKFEPLYTTPPKRPWVGLTDEEASWCQAPSTIETWKRIEAKLKEKNA